MFLIILIIVLLVLGRKQNIRKDLIVIGVTLFILVLSFFIVHILTAKKILEKEDFYGEYIIDRDFFSGKNADWQYRTYRFEIKENDSLYFYITKEGKNTKTLSGTISTIKPFTSSRLIINMRNSDYHILKTNPTIYREVWGFYLVFDSSKYGNMFFRKGVWKDVESYK